MEIQRHLERQLDLWRLQDMRVPLILQGARQVGKTFLVHQFSKKYAHFYEFNFQKNKEIHSFFQQSHDPKDLIKKLSLYSGADIDLQNDLIFFDEIQDCPEALNSLKYFSEDCQRSHIIAAGSFLGLYLSNYTFPVGKVHFETLYPLCFTEYLKAKNEHPGPAELILALNLSSEDEINFLNSFHALLLEQLKEYYMVGGMPKVVQTFLTQNKMSQAREVQNDLLLGYRADFAKYSGPSHALKILQVFENIPKQLAKDNRKFQFNLLKEKSRYQEFSTAIDWLVSAGLALKIPIIENAEIPLKAYIGENNFKLYFFDVGILSALSDLPLHSFQHNDSLFKTFKGAFSENFFLQEFRATRPEALYSWIGKTSEIDFLFQHQEDVDLSPIEVKSGESGKLKSLNVFFEKYHPKWKTRCNLLPIQINEQASFRNVPLYLTSKV